MLMRLTRFLIIVLTVWQADCYPRNICKKFANRAMCEKIYVWDKERQYFVSLANEIVKDFTTEEYENIKHKKMRVVVSHMWPYAYYNTSSRELIGFLGEIWNILTEKLKFAYEVIPVSYDTGLELMSSGKADVMLAAVVYKEGLMNVYYSHPYFYNWYHLYLKSPENRPSSVLYSTIFFSKLTLFSLLVFCLLTMSIWMTSWYLNSTFKIERRLSIPTCFLGVMSGYINQGFDLKLRTYSGRLQATTALMFGLMLYYAMNAALVAKIAAFEAYYPFESLPDIVNKKTLSLCLRTSSFVYNNFTDGNRNILPQWQRIANNERCLDIEIPLNIPKIICNDNVVVLESKVVMGSLSMMAKYSCTIEAFGEKYFISGNSFLMSKALREKRIIDKYVIFMRSMGVIKRLENKWIKGDQTVTTKTSTPQVTLGHTKHVFIFYAIAILVSLIILGLEILHDKYVNADIKVIDYRN